MRRVRFVLVALMVLLTGSISLAADILLGVGQTKTIDIPELTESSMLDFSGPIDVTQLRAERVGITGLNAGAGYIEVKTGTTTRRYSVQVVSMVPEDAVLQLKALLKDLEAPLQFSVVAGKAIVEGVIKTQADRLRFEQVMAMYPDVVNMVRIEAPQVQVGISVTLIEVEASSGHDAMLMDQAGVRSSRGDIGYDYDWENFQNYLHYPEEVWQKRFSWGLGLSIDLLKAIRALVDRGKAKIVASPRLVTINGERASLLSGGEIPYEVSSYYGANTEFKPYGVRLDVVPNVLPSGEVMLDMTIESSQPQSGSDPRLSTRRANIKTAVEKGKSLLVAGLSSSVASSSRRIGCFFPLFGTTASARKTELLVMVTPDAPSIVGFDKFEMIKPGDLKQ